LAQAVLAQVLVQSTLPQVCSLVSGANFVYPDE